VNAVAAQPDRPDAFLKIAAGTSPEFVEFPTHPHRQQSAADGFSLSYLPRTVAEHYGEASSCYNHGLLTAFASMCRLTAQAIFADLGEHGKLRLFDQLDEVRMLGGIDAANFSTVRRILLDDDLTSAGSDLTIHRNEAAVLMEVLKDLLYQTYVRGGKLRNALWMRRHFAAEKTDSDTAAD